MMLGPTDKRFDYTCLSTDTKLTYQVPNNATLLELDTGKIYIFRGAAGWVEYKQYISLADSDFAAISATNPLSTDGDSIYTKDIDLTYCTKVGWTGDILSLFSDLVSEIYNDTATSPKILRIKFKRTIYFNAMGIGCCTGKTFSNLKLEVLGSDDTVRYTYDDSANSTKYGTKLYSFEPVAGNGIILSFYTTDTVGLTNVTIQKETNVAARLKALMDDGTLVDIGASTGGSLKASIEDGQTAKRVGVDALSQLKVVKSVNLVGTSFSGTTKDPNFWTEVVTGSGVVSQDGEVILTTGITADSTAQYNSVRRARKVPGTVNQFRTVYRLQTPATGDCIRRIGAYDNLNGAFFQIDGNTVGVGARKAGVDSIITSDFNGNYGTTYPTPVQTAKRLVIDLTEYSFSFFINDILLHTIVASGASLCSTLDLPVRMEIINYGGNTIDNGFEVRFAGIQRLGEIETAGASKYLGANGTYVLKYGAGILQKITVTDNAGTIVAYDNTAASGTVLASIDALKTNGTLDLGASFYNGLTIVVAGGAKATYRYE